MVPSRFELVETLPKTLSGKIDRRSLPDPDWRASRHERAAPETETERRVAAIWQEVLGIDGVTADSDFLEVGGHSLVAMQVLARVRQEFATSLGIRSVFEAPTVRAFATALDAERAAGESPELSSEPQLVALPYEAPL